MSRLEESEARAALLAAADLDLDKYEAMELDHGWLFARRPEVDGFVLVGSTPFVVADSGRAQMLSFDEDYREVLKGLNTC